MIFWDWNIGPRDNFPSGLSTGTPRFVARRKVFEENNWYQGNVVGAMQELVAPSDKRLRSMFPKLEGFGNGLEPRLKHDDDRSGDNLAIYWGWDFEPQDFCLYRTGVIDNVDAGYIRGVLLKRKDTNRLAWFLTAHPPAGQVFESLRRRQLDQLLTMARKGDSKLNMPPVDIHKAVLGADLNSYAPSTKLGSVRQMLMVNHHLLDITHVLPDEKFHGNSLSTKVGSKAGRHIDAILIDRNITAESGRIVRSDLEPSTRRVLSKKELPADHRAVEAELVLSPR